jgi:L-lactate dehydrogenase complex protein LldG
MIGARAAILDRLRQAQRTGRVPIAHDVRVPDARTRDNSECLERFLVELAGLGVEHHVESTEGAVRARVATLVAGQPVLSWDAGHLPYGVGSALVNPATGASSRDEQARAAIGVTGCDGAIAETGTLVLLTGKGRPRTASLLPPAHLAVVRRQDLRFGMTEFFAERGDDIARATCCTFVSGPSRTADIELTLTLGVHGPGRVIVIVGP